MTTCHRCGAESPEEFVHCGFCGSPLASPRPERRKLATLLFCDMSGSTAMGERVDAETVRDLMFTYFHEMRGALKRHGGTVEKFIGDAVVAVFGAPQAHEDDALRACKAALEMQARLDTLNEELERRFGTRIALRIGLNTGEVVTGDPESRDTFVTGDPVNVAARLEQAAAPGEVLIGESTYRLVQATVTAESIAPLTLKGKSALMPAYRLLAVTGPELSSRRLGAPLVGREHEVHLLESEFERTLVNRACRLVTVVGEPGVGKSRLAAEVIEQIGPRARILRGRCLSYGEGMTYWPIGEIVRQAAGIREDHSPEETRSRIEETLERDPQARIVALRMTQLLGLTEGAATGPETTWAIRRFLRAQARSQPLLAVLDDIHWAEPALLDLLVALPREIMDAPLLLICLARPDFLEDHPEWEADVRLDPLGGDDVVSLVESLLPGGSIPSVVRTHISRASAGNPLFVEELLAMLLDEGLLRHDNGVWAMRGDLDSLALPDTLSALLGARLDRLDDDLRQTLERGSIEGEVFHRGAVVELSSIKTRASVAGHLERLAGKELVRPAEATFGEEAAFSFRHVLVREAAYAATAKKLRASLHERFADWLERVAGQRVGEFEEILGYHLEQSFRFRAELGPVDQEGRALGERAADRLAAAGSRALARGDIEAATNLLGRAAALLPVGSPPRIGLLTDLVEALFEAGRIREANAFVQEGIESAHSHGDEHLIAATRVLRFWLKIQTDPSGWSERALSESEQAVRIFERIGDDAALSRAWEVISNVHGLRGHLAAGRAAAERGLIHSERARDLRRQGQHRSNRVASAFFGETPFDEVDEEIKSTLAWARDTGSVGLEALALVALGITEAARGNLSHGQELITRGMSIISDLGMRLYAAGLVSNWIWLVTDDPAVAEMQLRESFETLVEAGDKGVLATVTMDLAAAVYEQGRYSEAWDLLSRSAADISDDDVGAQVQERAIRAKLLVRRGMVDEAEAVAREGLTLAGDTEYVDLRGNSLIALGEVLRLAGRLEEAAKPTLQAMHLWEAKGNVVWAGRARILLGRLSYPRAR